MKGFVEIDDFDYFVIPYGERSMSDNFQNLVNKYFDYEKSEEGKWIKNDKDLILCLIELVTLNDTDAVGNTVIRANFQKDAVKKFINKYEDIVKKVKDNENLVDGISRYKDWYKRNSYIFLYENESSSYKDTNKVSDWRKPPDLKHIDDRPRELYATNENELSDDDIQKYLNYYSSLLFEELDFKNYPNVCFMVKPIAVDNGIDDIPLGNLYMHFATVKPKTKHFYIKFLNSFMRVWFQENGYNVITEISDYSVKKEKEKVIKNIQEKPYLPVFNDRQKNKLTNRNLARKKNLEDYYNDLYLDEDRKNSFEQKLYRIAKEAITEFSSPPINGTLNINKISMKYTYRKSALKALKTKVCNNVFEGILIAREIYKIGILLFDFEPKLFLHSLNGKDSLNLKMNTTSHITTNSCVTFLWTDRFLPTFKNGDKEYVRGNIKKNIANSLCAIEKSYIERYREILSEIKSNK